MYDIVWDFGQFSVIKINNVVENVRENLKRRKEVVRLWTVDCGRYCGCMYLCKS